MSHDNFRLSHRVVYILSLIHFKRSKVFSKNEDPAFTRRQLLSSYKDHFTRLVSKRNGNFNKHLCLPNILQKYSSLTKSFVDVTFAV